MNRNFGVAVKVVSPEGSVLYGIEDLTEKQACRMALMHFPTDLVDGAEAHVIYDGVGDCSSCRTLITYKVIDGKLWKLDHRSSDTKKTLVR